MAPLELSDIQVVAIAVLASAGCAWLSIHVASGPYPRWTESKLGRIFAGVRVGAWSKQRKQRR